MHACMHCSFFSNFRDAKSTSGREVAGWSKSVTNVQIGSQGHTFKSLTIQTKKKICLCVFTTLVLQLDGMCIGKKKIEIDHSLTCLHGLLSIL